MRVSFYEEPITNIRSNQTFKLSEVFEIIKRDIFKKLTNQLRSLSDNEKPVFKKNKLPGVTFSGVFKDSRSDKNLIERSGVLVVDIDDLTENELTMARNNLTVVICNSPIVAFFISPSGNGLKVVLRVDYEKFSQKDNYEAAIQLLRYFTKLEEIKFDRSGSNPSRLCFLCHDAGIIINRLMLIDKNEPDDISSIDILDTAKWLPRKEDIDDKGNEIDKERLNANIIDVSKEDIVYSENGQLDFEHKDEHSNFNKLLILVLRKCGKYQKGNRHNYIQKLASFSNQFGMSLNKVIDYTTRYFEKHEATLDEASPFNIEKELIPIIKDTYSRYTDQYSKWKEPEIIEEFTTPCLPEEVYARLPFFFKDPCSMFDTGRERDVYFLSALGLTSNCFPLVQGRYDQHFIGMHLFIFLIAPASAGKGNMSWARRLGNGFDKFLRDKYKDESELYEAELRLYEAAKGDDKGARPIKPLKQRFFLAANSSSASIISSMHNNGFQGLIFESEADSLANMLKNDWGNYSDILRKAFHHEPILQQRKTNDEDLEIEKSYLSMVLSGTPSQVHNLFSTVENGLFSRLLVYDFPQNIKIKDVFAKKSVSLESYFDGLGTTLFSYAKPFFEKVDDDYQNQVLFEFTTEQEERFRKWHEQKMVQLHHLYGDDIVPSVKRLGGCFFKIAMLLSTFRFIENAIEIGKGNIDKLIVCTDNDYDNTETIINTLIFHTVTVFRHVKKFKRNKSSILLKDAYYNQLPAEFNRTVAMETASLIGLNGKTAEGYLAKFQQDGRLQKPRQNHYIKATF